ncbi:MAG: PorT family protein [Chitinophagaceae bacterium]|nr:MAG: PorT family protein [Chitinophagaceae bacterium]
MHANAVLATQSISAGGFSVNSQSRFGWKAGVVGELPLSGNLRLMPQVNLVSKGGKFAEDGEGLNLKLTYVEVPVLLTYNVSNFFFGAGPSVSFGVGGDVSISDGTETISTKVKFDGKEDADGEFAHLKSTDIGLQFIGGVNLPKGFFVNAHYSLGLTGITPGDNSEGSMKNRYFGFGIGMFFGK